MARSLGRNSRVGQLSTMTAAMALVSISANDWVTKTTLVFFLRKVLSHSRSCAPKVGSSRASQPSSTISKAGLPWSQPSTRWNREASTAGGEHGRSRACADPAFGLGGLDVGLSKPLGLGVQ